jgi:hypothetical protein
MRLMEWEHGLASQLKGDHQSTPLLFRLRGADPNDSWVALCIFSVASKDTLFGYVFYMLCSAYVFNQTSMRCI